MKSNLRYAIIGIDKNGNGRGFLLEAKPASYFIKVPNISRFINVKIIKP